MPRVSFKLVELVELVDIMVVRVRLDGEVG